MPGSTRSSCCWATARNGGGCAGGCGCGSGGRREKAESARLTDKVRPPLHHIPHLRDPLAPRQVRLRLQRLERQQISLGADERLPADVGAELLLGPVVAAAAHGDAPAA